MSKINHFEITPEKREKLDIAYADQITRSLRRTFATSEDHSPLCPDGLLPLDSYDFDNNSQVFALYSDGLVGSEFVSYATSKDIGQVACTVVVLTPWSFEHMHTKESRLYTRHGFMVNDYGQVCGGLSSTPIRIDWLDATSLNPRIFAELHESGAPLSLQPDTYERIRSKPLMLDDISRELTIAHYMVYKPGDSLESLHDFVGHLQTKLCIIKPVSGIQGSGFRVFSTEDFQAIEDYLATAHNPDNAGFLVERYIATDPIVSSQGFHSWNVRVVGGPLGAIDYTARIGAHMSPVNSAKGARSCSRESLHRLLNESGYNYTEIHDAITQASQLVAQIHPALFGADFTFENDTLVCHEVNYAHFGGLTTLLGQQLTHESKIEILQKVIENIVALAESYSHREGSDRSFASDTSAVVDLITISECTTREECESLIAQLENISFENDRDAFHAQWALIQFLLKHKAQLGDSYTTTVQKEIKKLQDVNPSSFITAKVTAKSTDVPLADKLSYLNWLEDFYPRNGEPRLLKSVAFALDGCIADSLKNLRLYKNFDDFDMGKFVYARLIILSALLGKERYFRYREHFRSGAYDTETIATKKVVDLIDSLLDHNSFFTTRRIFNDIAKGTIDTGNSVCNEALLRIAGSHYSLHQNVRQFEKVARTLHERHAGVSLDVYSLIQAMYSDITPHKDKRAIAELLGRYHDVIHLPRHFYEELENVEYDIAYVFRYAKKLSSKGTK